MYKVDFYSCLYNCPNSKRAIYKGGALNGQITQCCEYMRTIDFKKDIVICLIEKNHPLECEVSKRV